MIPFLRHRASDHFTPALTSAVGLSLAFCAAIGRVSRRAGVLMIRWCLCCLIAAFLSCGAPAKADFFQTGNDFVEECGTATSYNRTCMAYIIGIYQSTQVYNQNMRKFVCPPDKATNGQIYAVVDRWIRDHPEKWSDWLYISTYMALKTAWPCPAKPS